MILPESPFKLRQFEAQNCMDKVMDLHIKNKISA